MWNSASRAWGRWLGAAFVALTFGVCHADSAFAADHLDTPSVVADPSVDIGDVYAWADVGEGKLNLVMTLVGRTFSPGARYVFLVESGRRFGRTRTRTEIACRVRQANEVECRAEGRDIARGDASVPTGLESRNGRFRVFAGLRDDPFFNNVRGTRAAYQAAQAALGAGAVRDAAQCPLFDAQTVASIQREWRMTDGGPGANFLAGWSSSAIVISVDLDVVDRGGPILAVWAATRVGGRQVDRMGRPLTGNALLGTIASAEIRDGLKEAYNAASPRSGQRFAAEIANGLSLYDGFDGVCGNQLLASETSTAHRYSALAALLADDRLWINSQARVCTQFLAVELSALAGQRALSADCGGRTLTADAIDVYRSELTLGAIVGIDDGVNADDQAHSLDLFPFVAAPQPIAR